MSPALPHDLVGNFGLARWQPEGDMGVETRIIGTFGYLAPEYAQSGEVTKKADVYSFGVILVELITGRKAIDLNQPKGQQCLTEWMMWALKYDPDLCSVYEEDSNAPTEKSDGSKAKAKSTRQCSKYEKENMKSGRKGAEAALPISVFLVVSVLKDKSSKLLAEARGLDDVVKILNDMTGNLDAKKACIGALKLHKKYLKKRITYG